MGRECFSFGFLCFLFAAVLSEALSELIDQGLGLLTAQAAVLEAGLGSRV